MRPTRRHEGLMNAIFIFVFGALICQVDGQNLFRNAEFEEPLGLDNWFATSSTFDRSTNSYNGRYSGRVTYRLSRDGLSQVVYPEGGKAYRFSLQLKLLNQRQDMLWHEVSMRLAITYLDGSSETVLLGKSSYHTRAKEWIHIGADVRIYDAPVLGATFFIRLDELDVEYVVDEAVMEEIPEMREDWKEEADMRIDALRKNNIRFNLDISPEYDPSQIELTVNLKKHDFPFGSAVRAARFNGNSAVEQQYRDFFFDTFNWAVLENGLKWRLMERQEGVINYERPDQTIAMLQAQNVPIRGHCILWGVEKNTPDWIRDKDGGEVARDADRRIDYVTNYYKGVLEHWDVNNEQLHGDFFEQKLWNKNFMPQTFAKVHNIDPDVKLFLNDFQIVNLGFMTEAYINSARELLENDAPLHGLGLQSHIKGEPDIARIAYRLNRVAEVGLPLWITELDVDVPNIYVRARGYEDVMRLYFSHPSVEGILLWGFWAGAMSKPDAVLVDGTQTFTINEAGRRFVRLLKEEWGTSGSFGASGPNNSFELRGFHGDYEAVVTNNGDTIKTVQFNLERGEDIDVNITV